MKEKKRMHQVSSDAKGKTVPTEGTRAHEPKFYNWLRGLLWFEYHITWLFSHGRISESQHDECMDWIGWRVARPFLHIGWDEKTFALALATYELADKSTARRRRRVACLSQNSLRRAAVGRRAPERR
jgi:hypothetical protein